MVAANQTKTTSKGGKYEQGFPFPAQAQTPLEN